MKRIIVMCVVFFLLTTLALAGEFLASKNSSKYHDPSCILAQKIKPANLVKFASRDEAADKGFEPCKKCLANVTSKTEKD